MTERDTYLAVGSEGDAVLETTSTFSDVRTHAETGTTVATYDHDNDPLSVAIPELVARLEACHPCSLPPLYECVDPEALDGLFGDSRGDASRLGVSFDYHGYRVAVEAGSISVTPLQ